MNNNQNTNTNYEVDLSTMNMDQLIYLDKLLKENEQLKKRYNEEIYFANRNKVAFEIYGSVFSSVTEAAKSLGVTRPLLYYRMRTNPNFDAYFVKLNAKGEVISRSKTPPNRKSKNKEEDQKSDNQK